MSKEALVAVRFGTEFISRGGDETKVFIGKSIMRNPGSAARIMEYDGEEFIPFGYTPDRGNFLEATGRVWSAEDYIRGIIQKDKEFIERHGIEKALSVSDTLSTPEAYRSSLLVILRKALSDIQKGEFILSEGSSYSNFSTQNLISD